MKQHNMILALATAALALAPAAFCQDTGTSTLSATYGAEASFSASFSGTTLNASAKFGGYSGTTNFNYKIRTTQSSGSGAITVQVTAFGTGGPAVADLSYTCTDTASGTPCSTTGASTSSATNVVTFGPDAHSADAGDAGSVSWALVDRPSIKTGTYTSTATFSISAL